jgi:hypothetical protein
VELLNAPAAVDYVDIPLMMVALDDVMDIEHLWKHWTRLVPVLALHDQAIAYDEAAKLYRLNVFIYAPFQEAAKSWWLHLYGQLRAKRRR